MQRRKFINTTAIASAALFIGNSAFGFPDRKAIKNIFNIDGGNEIKWDEIRNFFLCSVFENRLNFVRASFHLYNNEEDVDRLLFEFKNL